MSFMNAIRDGESYAHYELQGCFGLRTERAAKEFIEEYDIPYEPVNGKWIVAGEDVRIALRRRAKTHRQRREEKQDGDNSEE